MKRVITAVLAVLFCASPLMAEPLASDRRIVPGVRIGSAALAPADQGALVREVGEPDETDQSGDHAYYRYGAGDPPDELVVDFDLGQDQPFEISTASGLYRTAEGLGVGTGAAAIRQALGRPLCEGLDPEGNGVIVYPSIWFLMSRGLASKVSIRSELGAKDFRDRAIPCR